MAMCCWYATTDKVNEGTVDFTDNLNLIHMLDRSYLARDFMLKLYRELNNLPENHYIVDSIRVDSKMAEVLVGRINDYVWPLLREEPPTLSSVEVFRLGDFVAITKTTLTNHGVALDEGRAYFLFGG